jgi:hypothetical protein
MNYRCAACCEEVNFEPGTVGVSIHSGRAKTHWVRYRNNESFFVTFPSSVSLHPDIKEQCHYWEPLPGFEVYRADH